MARPSVTDTALPSRSIAAGLAPVPETVRLFALDVPPRMLTRPAPCVLTTSRPLAVTAVPVEAQATAPP